jgi:uncharacterized protein (TIGR02266 family)
MTAKESPSALKQIPISLRNRKELFRRFLSEAPYGGLMVNTRESLAVGELVELKVRIEESGEAHELRGVVLWGRTEYGSPTAGIGFLSSEVERREQLLRDPATGDANAAERRETRYASTMKVTYHTTNDFVVDYTRNISTGGFFVDNPNPPAVGARILFRLFPPGVDQPIELPGLVAWKRPGQGFGVRFVSDNPDIRRKLDRLVRNIAFGTAEPISAPVFEEVNG